MASPLWQDRFPEFVGSEEKLHELLLSGKIPEAAYIQWASEKYLIPSLDNVFFSQLKNFNIVKENPSTEWSSDFFPVHEWQGTLYIACLEPREISLNKKHCFVLASYKTMLATWEKMNIEQSTTKVKTPPPVVKNATPLKAEKTPLPSPSVAQRVVTVQPKEPIAPAPAVAPKVIPVQPKEPIAPVVQVETQKADTSPQPSEKMAPAPAAAEKVVPTQSKEPIAPAAAVALKNASEQANEKMNEQVSPHETVPNWLPNIEPVVINSVDIEKDVDPFNASVVIPLGQLEALMEEASRISNRLDIEQKEKVKPPFPEIERTATNIKINPNLSQSQYKIPEITNVFRVNAPKEMTFTATKTIMPFPEATKDFTFIRTVYSDLVIINAEGKIQDNTNPQNALLSAFKVLKDYYQKIMWIVRDERGQAFPIACNDAWSLSDEAWLRPINFKDANPFRIAKFTQRPFHGTVFKNPINDQYFKNWNNGKYPDVMTVVPVKMGGKVFGYLVACDKGPHYHNQLTLEIIESVCKDLVNTFVRIHKELEIPESA